MRPVLETQYERPGSLQEAARLAGQGSKLLAGGQTLLASMKLGLASPPGLADLQDVPGLREIVQQGDALVIGAMARHADVAASPVVLRSIPGLAGLAAGIGDRQVRAMGTLGGSVANNDPAACYPAAVLGLGATVRTNQREIAADAFFQGLFATALQEDEVIAAVSFPVPRRSAYAKFRHPASRFALIGVFVAD
ncbi:MAG: carbon monoxide dehydrogenase, partial [Comamonadaceae bacterium]